MWKPAAVAWVVGSGIALLTVGGIVESQLGETELFYFDGELRDGPNAPVAFSTALLVAASVAAAALARHRTNGMRAVWVVLAAVFAVMALDEALALHEEIEHDASVGVEWQVLALPIILPAVAAWARVASAIRHSGSPLLLWSGGAAAWGVAQLLEFAGWDLVIAGTHVRRGGEEVIEMIGSGLFLIALVSLGARSIHPERSSSPSAKQPA